MASSILRPMCPPPCMPTLPDMSTITIRYRDDQPVRRWEQYIRWGVLGLFCIIFVYSAVWLLVDPEGGRLDFVELRYPGYVVYPLAVAKLVGIAVILSRQSWTLSVVAFSGFLYDVVLGLGAHVAARDPGRAAIAAVAIGVAIGALWLEHRRFAASSETAHIK